MKTNQSRIITYLRFSAGCAFFAAAAALAFVATSTNVLHADASTKYTALSKSSIRDSVNGAGAEKSTVDGSPVTPLTEAMEQAAKRAYPADETPFSAQLNAILGFKRFQATSASNAAPATAQKGKVSKLNRKQPPEAPRFNTWHPTGPTLSSDPSILTFSGAATTVSGRITALALDTASGCTPAFCRLWVGAAGGGIWRTTNALSNSPSWTFLTSFDVFSNAIGSMTYDNAHVNPLTGNAPLYVGTGEPNASADSEAGLGLMKSLDGGDSWIQVPSLTAPITTNSPGTGSNGTYSGNAFFGRAISKVVIDPTNTNIIYVASTRAVRGIDESYGGPTSNPPVPRPPFGLWKSTDAGQHFTFIFDGDGSCGATTCLGGGAVSSIRGVHDLALDPSNHNIVYAADFPGPGGGGGVWRSNDAGSTWTQIQPALTPGDNVDRCSFSVTTLPGPNTRMYVGCGNDGAATAQVYRSDLVQTGVPTFTNLTALEVVPSTAGYCSSQCWYDNVIYTPPGFPNIIYVGGSYTYNECAEGSDCRGVVYATDAGSSGSLWSDATWDAQNSGPNPGSCCNPNAVTPNQMHPDHHFIVTVPGSPFQFFDGSDGGLVRTDGNLVDISAQCAARTYPPGTGTLFQCQLLLGIGCPVPGFPCGVPNRITSLNAGLNTLQFMSFSVAGNNPVHLMGGTQDNGTFDTIGSFNWNQVIYGDGGQSGFNQNNSNLRFNTFTFQQHDANFQNGNPAAWVVIGGPIFGDGVLAPFYPAIIPDPTSAAASTIFEGTRHVWRTQDWGGSQAFLETNCPEFTTSSQNPACGDFVPLGGPAGTNTVGDLGGTVYGADRRPTSASRLVEAIARTTSNTSVAWASTAGGRVFISTNVDTNPAVNVIWNRLDADTTSPVNSKDPTRVPTGIAIDTINNFHAWVSYSGYNFNTPSQPGHIFSVNWSGAGTATWTDITGNLPDLPLTDVVFDPVTRDLYVSCDFIVFRLAAGHTIWDVAGLGMPIVEVPHLTIVPGARVLYASTHGLGGWFMQLYNP